MCVHVCVDGSIVGGQGADSSGLGEERRDVVGAMKKI